MEQKLQFCWFALLIWAMSALSVVAQHTDKRQRANDFVLQAMAFMQENNYEQALPLWLQAQQNEPNNDQYAYEIARCYYENKDYKTAIKVLKKNLPTDKPETITNHYRLLAACYEQRSEHENAIETLQTAIGLAPNAGGLYADLGGLYYQKGYNDQAVTTWEQGVDSDPEHSTNYYWLAQMYAHSSEPFWALFYAELFINIAPNTQRAMEMSQLLGETYRKILHRQTNPILSWTGYDDLLLIDDATEEMSACTQLEKIAQAVVSTAKCDFDSLNNVILFRQQLFEKALQTKSLGHNTLLLWQQKVQQAEHWEAYNYWLLRKSDPSSFDRWLQFHRYDLGAFLNWVETHHLRLDAVNKVSRKNFYAIR